MKCPLLTTYDLDCIEDCGNVTCKHWKEGDHREETCEERSQESR
jgi:hypothetical protein